jgi:thiol-disulfide isomerase/thioredoxin
MNALIAVLFAILVLNLLLTMGVLRRLKEHEQTLSTINHGHESTNQPGISVGDSIVPFEATSLDGVTLSESSGTSGALIGFFLRGCAPCKELLPTFIEAAGLERTVRPIAVITGFDSDDNEYSAALRGVAHVVMADSVQEPPAGEISAAFKVTTYPFVCRTGNDGKIESVGARATFGNVHAA